MNWMYRQLTGLQFKKKAACKADARDKSNIWKKSLSKTENWPSF